MTLAIDSSTPARFNATTNGSGVVTTGTFNTPANCLLIVTLEASGTTGINETYALTNNGAATTWSTIGQANFTATGNNDFAGAYWTYLSAARTGMTITATNSTGGAGIYTSIKIYNVTGATPSLPIGGVSVNGTSGSPVTTTGFTITANGSLGFVVACDSTDSGAVTSTDTAFDAFVNTFDVAGGSGYKTLGSSGGTATFNITGGSGAIWNYVTFEVKAATTGGGVPPTPSIPTFTNGTVLHATDLNALSSNFANLYNYTMSGFWDHKTITVIRITGTFSLATGPPYNIVKFDTVDLDTNGLFDSFTNNNTGNTVLTVRTPGVYRLYLQYNQAPGTVLTGFTYAHICVNGTVPSTNAVSGSIMGSRSTNSQATIGLSTGNQIYGVIQQNTGSVTDSSLPFGGSYLVAEWLSP